MALAKRTGETGTITAVSEAVTFDLQGTYAVCGVELSGTWVGTLQFEGLIGVTWTSVNATPPTTTTAVTSSTANGRWIVSTAGLSQIRVRASAFASGTATVSLAATQSGGPAGSTGIDQTTPGTTDSVSVKSSAYTSQPTVTRPANATPYTAGDVLGGAITFTSVGPTAGHVLITSADLRVNVDAVPSGMANMRLHLYDVTPPSAIADNAAWDLPSGDRASYLGYLDLGTPADLGSTLYVQITNPGLQVKLASASTSLYGYLQTIGAFTPAGNSEVYAPRLRTVGV